MKTVKSISTFMAVACLVSITLNSCTKKEGCTDIAALNYDNEADKDDGSCIYVPDACFTASTNSAAVSQAVGFLNCSSNYTSAVWTFGDGLGSNEQNPTHSYSAAGNYTVTLTVTGDNGSDQASTVVSVTGDNPNIPDCQEYNYGWIKVHNTHDSNYRVYINGVYKGNVSGYGYTASFQYNSGTNATIYAEQIDGYILYPSEFTSYGTVLQCQTTTVNF